MKLKDALLGLCLAALLVMEFLLFSANQKKTAAQTALREAQHQVETLQAENDRLKADNAAAQATDIVSLRAENKNLARKLAELQNENTRLGASNQWLFKQLTLLSDTAQQQEQQLEAWAAASRQARAAAQAMTEAEQRAARDRTICIKNLHDLDAAKQKWALENNKTDVDVPTEQDLLPYLPNHLFPVCPAGGTYSINAVGLPPTCSIPGHAIQ
jgi:septal ring factor EnvC (AmiA/AmiB activator)